MEGATRPLANPASQQAWLQLPSTPAGRAAAPSKGLPRRAAAHLRGGVELLQLVQRGQRLLQLQALDGHRLDEVPLQEAVAAVEDEVHVAGTAVPLLHYVQPVALGLGGQGPRGGEAAAWGSCPAGTLRLSASQPPRRSCMAAAAPTGSTATHRPSPAPQPPHLIWVEGLGGRLDLGLLAKVGAGVLGLAVGHGREVQARHNLDRALLLSGSQVEGRGGPTAAGWGASAARVATAWRGAHWRRPDSSECCRINRPTCTELSTSTTLARSPL